MENMIFSVSFHTRSPKGTHTFWFTDFDMAFQFSLSLQMNPKVTDCTVYEMDANIAAEYDRKVKAPQIRVTDSWERGQRPNRPLKTQIDALEQTDQAEHTTTQNPAEQTTEHDAPQSVGEATAADAAERMEKKHEE